MDRATYEFLPNDKLYYGELLGFDGVYAISANLEDCREELLSVLGGWLLLSASQNQQIPIPDTL